MSLYSLASGFFAAALMLALVVAICERERQRRTKAFSLGRDILTADEQNNLFSPGHDATPVLNEIAKIYRVDRGVLRPTDRFSVELRYLSVGPADVKLELVESMFRKRTKREGSTSPVRPDTLGDFVQTLVQIRAAD
jgi:hypothetical protein